MLVSLVHAFRHHRYKVAHNCCKNGMLRQMGQMGYRALQTDSDRHPSDISDYVGSGRSIWKMFIYELLCS